MSERLEESSASVTVGLGVRSTEGADPEASQNKE